MSTVKGQVTRLLEAARDGEARAADELLPLVYEELRRLAHRRLRGEQGVVTLPATALVHEAYMRLVGENDPGWENRRHFFGAAAEAMRRVAVEYARAARRRKRGGGLRQVTLNTLEDPEQHTTEELVDLEDALGRLEGEDEAMARVVKLRYFAGLTVEETARVLDQSPRTVNRQWTAARAWLNRALTAP